MKPYYQRAGWRWLPGMAYRWAGSDDRVQDWEPGEIRKDGSCVPILTDPATQGAALAVLREVTGDPHLWLGYYRTMSGPRWILTTRGERGIPLPMDYCDGVTEAEALAATLDRLIPE